MSWFGSTAVAALAVVLPAPQRGEYIVDSSTNLTIAHLDGIRWQDAELPKRRHQCWAQTWGVGENARVSVMRCACGGLSFDRGRTWEGVNQRRYGARQGRRSERRARRSLRLMSR